jgi:hypothetical protein
VVWVSSVVSSVWLSGVWCVVCGVWCVVCGEWCVVWASSVVSSVLLSGVWCGRVVWCEWCVASGVRVCGEWCEGVS